MTDTAIAAPSAGWYPDPSGRAPYRWWSGRGWTPETRQDPVKTSQDLGRPEGVRLPTSSPPPSPTRESPGRPAPEARITVPQARDARRSEPPATPAPPPMPPLPTRRSLRDLSSASTSAAVASPPAGPAEQPGTSAFAVPPAWVSNASATPTWSSTSSGSAAPFASATPFAGAGAAPTNTPARLSLTFALLVIVVNDITTRVTDVGALASPVAKLALVVVGFTVLVLAFAGVPLGIVGIVKSARLVRFGHRARGRAMAIVGLILCTIFAGLFSLAFVTGVVAGFTHALAR